MIVQAPDLIIYPSSDGKPMAENTRQFEWIVTIKCGMEHVFRNDPNVFVAGDLLWYPVQGQPQICAAPDTMIVFGRPKGFRLSYLQWEEANLPPQVVFEVRSPSNSERELIRKWEFYDSHGVEEYYLFDPEEVDLQGWIRRHETLQRIPRILEGWTSPRLQVRLEMEDDLVLYGPDGSRFLTYGEIATQLEQAQQQADQERHRAEQEKLRAEQEKQRAEQEKQRAEVAETKIQRLLDKLRAAGLDPNGESP